MRDQLLLGNKVQQAGIRGRARSRLLQRGEQLQQLHVDRAEEVPVDTPEREAAYVRLHTAKDFREEGASKVQAAARRGGGAAA